MRSRADGADEPAEKDGPFSSSLRTHLTHTLFIVCVTHTLAHTLGCEGVLCSPVHECAKLPLSAKCPRSRPSVRCDVHSTKNRMETMFSVRHLTLKLRSQSLNEEPHNEKVTLYPLLTLSIYCSPSVKLIKCSVLCKTPAGVCSECVRTSGYDTTRFSLAECVLRRMGGVNAWPKMADTPIHIHSGAHT